MTRASLFIRLDRDDFANGKLRGRLGRQVLRRRVARTRAVQQAQKIPGRLIAARIRDFTRAVQKVAPHWLVEAAGLARGAGVSADDLLMLNCLPPGFYPPEGHNCTSFIAIGRNENQLFKIRDERNHVQGFFTQRLPNGRWMQIGHDLGNLGAPHFFTSGALAGANNTGSKTKLVSDAPLLNDCHILRFLGERATTVRQIPPLMEYLLDRKVANGASAERGAIFLFADPEGGLLLESQAFDYATRFVDRGILVAANHYLTGKAQSWASQPPNKNTLLRYQRMTELLRCCHHPPRPAEVFALSRDRKNLPHSLCNDDRVHFWMTISAQLQVINRRQPHQSVNYVCCGNTRHSLYLPMPLTFTESYGPLVSGAFYEQADRLYRKFIGHNRLRGAQLTFETSALSRSDPRSTFLAASNVISRALKGS